VSEVAPAQVHAATASADTDMKRCPNCGATATEQFCPNCGQETKLRLPTLREFLREAAGRYVALDGRFWRTIIALMFRPGRLTREYFAGRRRRFIRPARLYLFSTLVFFAVTRFFVEPATIVNLDSDARSGGSKRAAENVERPESGKSATGFYLDDDVQLHVPDDLPGGSILKQRWQRFERLSTGEKTEQLADGMLRYGPYAMFCLLPAFAFLLKLVYLGRQGRYPLRPRLYGEHMVFAAHDHAFFFVACTAALLVPSRLFRGLVICWIVIYLWRSLRAVYGGSWLGAGLRASFLLLAYSVLVGIATAGLLVAAILLR
jgi:hypothetical protein